MFIPNQTPIATDAVAAKVYNQLHLYTLSVMHPTGDSGTIVVELLPATSDGELAPGSRLQRISCPLYPTMSEVPELAAAFAAIITAIPATQAYFASQNNDSGQSP